MRSNILLLAALIAIPTAASAQTLDDQMQHMHQAPAEIPAGAVRFSAAPESSVDSTGNSAIPALALESQTSNNVTYINGGISDEELAQVKAQAGQFNLHVLLSAPQGAYISDVSLRLLDSKGAVLVSVDDAGPYFYAKLQPGHYTLQTMLKGDAAAKSTKVTIGKGTVKQHIVYNQ